MIDTLKVTTDSFLTVPGHPPRGDVRAEPVPGEASITVSWRAPDVQPNDPPITGYRIRYHIRSGGPSTSMEVSQSPVTLTGLHFSTEYRVYVAARDRTGLGPECCIGTELYVRTSDGELSNPNGYLLSKNVCMAVVLYKQSFISNDSLR